MHQSELMRCAGYDRKWMARPTWAGWFKWQVIEQQTRINSVLMSSVFHLGSIRRLEEAEANTYCRGMLGYAAEKTEMTVYWTASQQYKEGAGFVCLNGKTLEKKHDYTKMFRSQTFICAPMTVTSPIPSCRQVTITSYSRKYLCFQKKFY